MSHVVTIETQVRDPAGISLACQRLHLPEPVLGTTTLFSTDATGWQVQFPDWRYPIVCNLDQGKVHFDNFAGRWGDPAHLDRFLQYYAVETVKLEARKKGYLAIEQPLTDGSIKVTIQTGV